MIENVVTILKVVNHFSIHRSFSCRSENADFWPLTHWVNLIPAGWDGNLPVINYYTTTWTVSEMSRCRSPLRYLPSSPLRRTLHRWDVDVELSPFTVVEMDLCGRRPPLLTKPRGLLRSFPLTGTIFLSIRSHFARIQSSRSQYFTNSNFTEGLLQKLPHIHQTSSDWSTVVMSHAAIHSDARRIQISSQHIRIRC